MKAPIPLVILLHAVVVLCQKVVSKRGSGKAHHFLTDSFKWFVARDKMCLCLCYDNDSGKKVSF